MPYLFVNKSFLVRVVLSFLILVQNLIPLLYIDKAYADAEEYDLRVSKTSSSTGSLVSGQVVVYTIAYGNSGSNTVTGATLWDSFGTGLIYSGILSSTPSLGSPMLNTGVSPHTLTWSNITMGPNMSGNIQLQFVVNGTQLSSGSFIQNQAQLSGCSQSCTQEAKETSQSASFIVQGIPYAPSTSDLYIKKYVGQCNIGGGGSISCSNTSTTGYKVGDTVYFSYHYKNTGTNLRDNVVLVDQYDGNLSFSHIVSTSGPLGSYQLAQGGTMFNSDMRYGIVSWSDGMTLNPGQSGMVVMAFKITTDKIGTILNNVKIGTLTDPGELGKILYLTGSPSPLIVGETNSTNNLSNTGIVTRPFDHRITKQLISGTPGPNAVVTYRLSIAVSGYVVPDITIVDAPTFAGTLVDRSSSNIIVGSGGYACAGDGTSPFFVSSTPVATGGSVQNICFSRVNLLGVNTTGFIDITIQMPPCDPGVNSNIAYVTLPYQNYTKAAMLSLHPNFFDLTETREVNISNNSSSVSVSLPSCPDEGTGYGDDYDLVMVSKTADKLVALAGELITYTIQFQNNGTSDKFVYLQDSTNAGMQYDKRLPYEHTGKFQKISDTPALMKYIQLWTNTGAGQLQTLHQDILQSTTQTNPGKAALLLTTKQIADSLRTILGDNAFADGLTQYYATGVTGCNDFWTMLYGGLLQDIVNSQEGLNTTYVSEYNGQIALGVHPALAHAHASASAWSWWHAYTLTHPRPTQASSLAYQCSYDLFEQTFAKLGSPQTTNYLLGVATEQSDSFSSWTKHFHTISFYDRYVLSPGLGGIKIPDQFFSAYFGLNSMYVGLQGMNTNIQATLDNPNLSSSQVYDIIYDYLLAQGYTDRYVDLEYVNTNALGPVQNQTTGGEYTTPSSFKVNVYDSLGGYVGTRSYDDLNQYLNTLNLSDCIFGSKSKEYFCALGGGLYGPLGTLINYSRLGSLGTYGSGLYNGTMLLNAKDYTAPGVVQQNGAADVAFVSTGDDVGNGGYANDYANEGYLIKANTTYTLRYNMVMGQYPSGTVINNTALISMCENNIPPCVMGNHNRLPETNPGGNNTASTSVTALGSPTYDLSISNVANPLTYTPGGSVTYTINYCNNTASTLSDIAVKFSYDAGMSLLGVGGMVPEGGYSHDSSHRVITFTGSTLGANTCKQMFVSMNIGLGQTGNLATDALIGIMASGGVFNHISDSNQFNNQQDTTITTTAPDTYDTVSEKIIIGSPTYNTGTTVTYRLSYINNASVPLVLTVTDALDTGSVTYDSATMTPTSTTNGVIVRENIVLNPGDSWTADVTVMINNDKKAGDLVVNVARYRAVFSEDCMCLPQNTANDLSISSLPFEGTTGSFDLALTKSLSGSGPFTSGSVIEFVITLTNQGTLPASGISIIDYIPSGLTLDDSDRTSSGSNALITLPSTLNPGASTSVVLTLQVNGTLTGILTNLSEIYTTSGGIDIDSNYNTDANDDLWNTGSIDNDITTMSGDHHDGVSFDVNDTPVFDLALTKSLSGSGPFTSGSVIEFVITLTNQGTLPASGISIIDYIPSGLTLDDSDRTSSGSNALITLPSTLNPGASTSVVLTLQVNGTLTGILTNLSEIYTTSGGIDIDSNYNTDANDDLWNTGSIDNDITTMSGDHHDGVSFDVNDTPVFDLALTKSLSGSGPFTSGSVIEFVITLTNQGTLPASGISIIDYIPSGLTLDDSDRTSSGSNALITLPSTLNPGASTSVVLTLQVNGTLTGILTNLSEIYTTSGGIDIDSNYNTDANDDLWNTGSIDNDITTMSGDHHDGVSFDVNDTPVFDLALTKSLSGSGPFTSGSVIEFVITLTNQGTLPASGISIIDYIPSGLTLDDSDRTSSGSNALITLPSTLNPGASTSVVLTLQVNGTLTGILTNLSEIYTTSGGIDIDSNYNTDANDDLWNTGSIDNDITTMSGDHHDGVSFVISYTPSFDFGITKSGFSTASSGELVSYTLIATNYGPDTAFDIIVADTLPVDFSISDSGTTQGTRDGSSRSIGTLTPGQTVTLTLTGSYNTSGSKTNTAFLSGFTGATETGVQSNTGTTTGIVGYTPSFDFGLTKSGFSTASSGELVSYTLIATNYGPDTAFDIIVADTLPVDFSISDSGTTQGTRDGSSRSIGTLTPGQTVTLTLTGSYNTSGSKTNTAFLSGFTGATETGVQSNTGTTTGIVGYTPSFDFGLTKSGFSTASSGELVSYTLIATNYGPDTAFDIIVADTLPVDFSISDSGTTQGTRDGSSRSIGTLTPGQTVTLTLTGSYNTSGSKTNTAFLSGFTGATETGVQSNTGTTTGIVGYTPSFDFGITKSGFSTASSGELVSYTLIATNYGPDTAFDIIVADTLPVDFSISDSGTTQGTRDGSSRSIGTLTPGQTVTLTLTGSYNTSGSKTNTAFLSGFTGATETGVQSNTGTTTGIVGYTPSFDFGLTKSGFSTASSGELVSYTLIATNYGPDTAFDIIVADTLPVDFSISDSGTTQGTRDGSSRSIGTLTPGQTVTLTLTGSYNTSGSKTNTAFLSGFTGATETGVQSNTGTTTGIVGYTPSFDFGLTKSGFSTASSGELVSYTLIATNYGPDTAFDIIVADTLPVDFSVSDSGTTQGTRDGSSRSIGTLTPGQTVTLTLTGSYNTSGSKTNTAFLSGFTGATETGVQSNTGTTTDTVTQSGYDLRTYKVVSTDTANLGDQITYTIVYGNYGPNLATGVVVQDVFPSDVLNFDSSNPVYDAFSGSIYARDVGPLAPGQTAMVVLTATVIDIPSGGVISNMSLVGKNISGLTDTLGYDDLDAYNNIDTVTGNAYFVDLAVDKTVDQNIIMSGDTVTYTIYYSNDGTTGASGVLIYDILPAGFTYLSSDPSGVYDSSTGGSDIYVWNIGSLNPGSSGMIVVTGIAVGLSGDLVENVALIESNSIEEQTGNNVVLVSSVITAIPTSDFTGTVLLTGSDDPVSGLLLTVYSGTDPITSGFTNASGQLIITGLPVGSYAYSYDPADLLVLGYIPAGNTTGPNNTTLYVVVPTSDFTGTVLLTGSDDPVSGLLLTVYSGADPITSGFTNASGQLIITGLPVGSYTYSYDPADLLVLGYIPAGNTTGPNNTTLYVVVPTSDFTGTVLLTGSDDPVSGLLLTVYSGTDPITSGFTNASGQLIITGLPVGSYTYSYDPADLLVLGYIPAGNTTGPNNTTLYVIVPTSDFTGTVLLTGSNAPISGLLLTVYSGADPITSGFTNASGQLIITGLPVGSYTYSYDPADLLFLGYIPAGNTTGPNNTTLYVVVPTSDFTGTVLLTGSNAPISGLLLTVYSGADPITSGFTNASGQLIITGLPVGSYTYSYDPADLLVLGYIPAGNTTGPNNTTLYVMQQAARPPSNSSSGTPGGGPYSRPPAPMPQIPTHSVANTPPSLDTVDVSSWKQELDDLRQAAQDKYLPKKVVKPVLEQENLDPLVLPNTGAPYDPNTSVLIPRFDEVELKAGFKADAYFVGATTQVIIPLSGTQFNPVGSHGSTYVLSHMVQSYPFGIISLINPHLIDYIVKMNIGLDDVLYLYTRGNQDYSISAYRLKEVQSICNFNRMGDGKLVVSLAPSVAGCIVFEQLMEPMVYKLGAR